MMRRRLPTIKGRAGVQWRVAAGILLCWLMGARVSAQSPVALGQYHTGMRFYFPDDSVKRVTRQMMPGYSHIAAGVMLYIPGIFETYDRMVMKTFRLDSIVSRNIFDLFGNKKSTVCFVLVNASDTLYYVFPVSNANVLPGAILMDDVRDAGAMYKGKSFYARFGIGTLKLRYQEVVITDVGPGTMYGPVRLDYRVRDKVVTGSRQANVTGSGNANITGSIDVITTGTNVLPVYYPGHLFADYFLTVNPRDAVEPISDENWALICQGRVGEKMTSKQVAFALGKADKVQRTVTAAGETEEWDYAGVQVYLEGDKVMKVIYLSAGK